MALTYLVYLSHWDKYYKDMKDEIPHKDVSRVEKDIKDKSWKMKMPLWSQKHGLA